MILAKLILTESSPLYYTGDGTVCEGGLQIQAGQVVSFATYFNAFFYGPYVRHTKIQTVRFVCQASGRVSQKLVCVSWEHRQPIVLSPVFSIRDLPPDGMVYCALKARECATVHAAWFETDTKPLQDVHLAAVICTYHREDYVRRNLQKLRSVVDVFVIDNGNSLPEQTDTAHGHTLQVLHNKNCGGSGGFTRGILEARRAGYTHVLLLDDDISFHTETVRRTIALLQLLQTQRACIGGQMLIEEDPCIQFASGAVFRDGRACEINRGLDMSKRSDLLYNARAVQADYQAWWYCCFALRDIDQTGLPLPLFIKSDDVEYGLRMRPAIILVNGIGIWHMSFAKKYNPRLEYYIKRNELIVCSIHGVYDGLLQNLWKLCRVLGKSLLQRSPETLAYALQGYEDFLKGPDFLLHTDGEQLHQSLHGSTGIGKLLWHMLRGFDRAKQGYLDHYQALTTADFWRDYLQLDLHEP